MIHRASSSPFIFPLNFSPGPAVARGRERAPMGATVSATDFATPLLWDAEQSRSMFIAQKFDY